tara:strand:+ start:75 stop:380 length:306 start_codon:yes stop_codon:yes gene_type:complete
MAIFDWKCDCGNVWEEITLQGEQEPNQCPKCNKNSITKCMGASIAVFKGNGFPTWDSKVANSVKQMQEQHKKKSYLKTNDGVTTAQDSSDRQKISTAWASK